MISILFRLFLGIILVILPFSLFIKKVSNELKKFIDILILKKFCREQREIVRKLVTILIIVIVEYMGMWGKIADLIVPGQSTIYIHASEEWKRQPDFLRDLRLQVTVVKFNGDLNNNKICHGLFDYYTDTFTQVYDFGIGERQILVEIYFSRGIRQLISRDYVSVSPLTRVKSGEKHFYIKTKEKDRNCFISIKGIIIIFFSLTTGYILGYIFGRNKKISLASVKSKDTHS